MIIFDILIFLSSGRDVRPLWLVCFLVYAVRLKSRVHVVAIVAHLIGSDAESSEVRDNARTIIKGRSDAVQSNVAQKFFLDNRILAIVISLAHNQDVVFSASIIQPLR